MNTPRRPTVFTLVPMALLMLAACAAPGGQPAESATPDATGSPTESIPTEEADATMPDRPPSIPEEIWAAILQELPGNFSGAPTVVIAEAVTWSDGSLGCPEPGMMYTQALVPGYRVVLEVDGEELHFHASESGQVVLCDDPQPPLEGSVDR